MFNESHFFFNNKLNHERHDKATNNLCPEVPELNIKRKPSFYWGTCYII